MMSLEGAVTAGVLPSMLELMKHQDFHPLNSSLKCHGDSTERIGVRVRVEACDRGAALS